MEGKPIAARPIGKLTRFVRLCLRHRAITAAVVTVFISLALLAVTGFELARRERENMFVQTTLAKEAIESKGQIRKAWHTGLDRMNEAMSEMQTNLFSRGIPLVDAPKDQRKAFEVWGSLVAEYLQQLDDDEFWGYFEVKCVGMVINLETQLSRELLPPEKLARMLTKAADVLDELMNKSPNDEGLVNLRTIINDYSQMLGLKTR